MIKVFVERDGSETKEISLQTGTTSELISKLGTNDDSVLLIDRGGTIYTKDSKIGDKANIKVIEVFSGG